jgi:hypothetical protein
MPERSALFFIGLGQLMARQGVKALEDAERDLVLKFHFRV